MVVSVIYVFVPGCEFVVFCVSSVILCFESAPSFSVMKEQLSCVPLCAMMFFGILQHFLLLLYSWHLVFFGVTGLS